MNRNIPLLMALLKVLIHVPFLTRYGYHRDELLYLALGRHLDWGYWSNPPMIGLLTFFQQTLLGDALWITRLMAAILGGLLVYLTGMIVKELDGDWKAQLLACLGMLLGMAFLRTGGLLQPVAVDILFWTWSFYWLIRFIKTEEERHLWMLGLSFGLGLMNKYLIGLLILATVVACLISPFRKWWLRRGPYVAMGLTLLLILPNLLWQWAYDFPVVKHLSELSENQLSNVRPSDFLLEQVLMTLPAVVFWLPGLLNVTFAERFRRYRMLAWIYFFCIIGLLILGGKSYYSLGLYPVLIAFGGVVWARGLKKAWQLWTVAGVLILLNIPFLPMGMPILPLSTAPTYFEVLANEYRIEGPVRWEGGHTERLPQDYADMLGWVELAGIVREAIMEIGDQPYLIYAENYGQAAAIDLYGKKHGWQETVSFSDTYRLWLPEKVPEDLAAFIYVNDELGQDVQAAFYTIREVGRIENPLARESGTMVFLCTDPKPGFVELFEERTATVRATFGK